MKALLNILHAAHCHNTHQWFAVDALKLVQTDPGKRLARLLTCNYDRYLIGAIDPDIRFRDYQNHVIHVSQGYWGGAPRVAHSWYDRMQRYLRTDRFADAAHAAGVLSHYFTDVMHPLHTGTGELERVLQGPIECGITHGYDDILRAWQEDEMRVVFQLSHGVGWLGEAMLHGARFAYRNRKPLLESFSLDAAASDPRLGLNVQSQSLLAEAFGLAITGLARVLERAAADAEASRGTQLPRCSLIPATLLAGMEAPLRRWLRRINHKSERAEVGLLIDEFRRTGTVKQHLPAEVDIIQRVVRVYRDEQRWRKERQRRLDSKLTVVGVDSESQHESGEATPATIPFVPRDSSNRGLVRQNPLVEAPTIGPKTAARFSAVGIHTVGDLIDTSPQVIAKRLATYWITAETVRQWQAQATLMCEIPGLKESHSQLLAGAGYDCAASVAAADSDTLHQRVSRFALTTSGRRYLRGSQPPTLSMVTRWIADAAGRVTTPALRRSA